MNRIAPGAILWLTGLSGSGKSTLASLVGARLAARRSVEILDADELRTHLSKGLGFTKEDRDANVRRIGFVARLLSRHGVLVIAAAISPYADTRNELRQLSASEGTAFIEVFLDAPLPALVERDVKGLYRRALAGEIPHFTGISDPYEAPINPDLLIRTSTESAEASAQRIVDLLETRHLAGQASSV